jgi:hypothetical protein
VGNGERIPRTLDFDHGEDEIRFEIVRAGCADDRAGDAEPLVNGQACGDRTADEKCGLRGPDLRQ